MRRLLPYVAVMVIYLMTPGTGELAENIVHLVMTGHTAHSIDVPDHEPKGDEHGCSGTFHVCPCHTSISFLLGMKAEAAEARTTRSFLHWPADDAKADGYPTSLFRPPIA